jgi:hypothetical protein
MKEIARMRVYLAAFILALLGASSGSHAQPASKSFIVTHSMNYKNAVDLSAYGVPKSPMIYEALLFPSRKSDEIIEGEELKRVINGIKLGPLPLIIDIERWSIYSDNEDARGKSREKFLKVLESIRAARPGIKVGYYDVVPVMRYWPVVDVARKSEKRSWENLNKRAAEDFVPHVDAIFPSLYTLYGDQQGWKAYAEETLRVTKSFGKPVYCFLWPKYQGGDRELTGKYLSAEYWNLELETCYKYADGIVIWNHEPNKEWDPNTEWWQQTLKFMKAHSLSK